VIRVPIAIDIAHQRPKQTDKIIPGLNRRDIDSGGLDEVSPVGEEDRVHIMRQAENTPSGCPGRKRWRINLLINPLSLYGGGQVRKAHVFQWTHEGLGDKLHIGFDEVRQRRLREKPRQQAPLQRTGG
jgi:hypothetical protein